MPRWHRECGRNHCPALVVYVVLCIRPRWRAEYVRHHAPAVALSCTVQHMVDIPVSQIQGADLELYHGNPSGQNFRADSWSRSWILRCFRLWKSSSRWCESFHRGPLNNSLPSSWLMFLCPCLARTFRGRRSFADEGVPQRFFLRRVGVGLRCTTVSTINSDLC